MDQGKQSSRRHRLRVLLAGLSMVMVLSITICMPSRGYAQAEYTPQAPQEQEEETYTPPESYQGFYDPDKIAAEIAAQQAANAAAQDDAQTQDAVILPADTPLGTTEDLKLSLMDVMSARVQMGDGVPTQRAAVVLKAQSLLNKVPYFWAGKSLQIGWDDRWGNEATVVGDISTNGQVLPYGMDCSGFVTWSFNNAAGSCTFASIIGSGTDGQWEKSAAIELADAQPGDLVFQQTPQDVGTNHVGILAGRDENGDWLVLHCASSKGTVVQTKLSAGGFAYVRRPAIYGEDDGSTAFADGVLGCMQTEYASDIKLYDSLQAFGAQDVLDTIGAQ